MVGFDIGALRIRTGFWGQIYYSCNKEPPRSSIGNYFGPYICDPDATDTTFITLMSKSETTVTRIGCVLGRDPRDSFGCRVAILEKCAQSQMLRSRPGVRRGYDGGRGRRTENRDHICKPV